MRSGFLDSAVARYLADHAPPESELVHRLRAETARLPGATMQIGRDQAGFLALLVRLMGARRALEVGTFTGMSALAVAAALPPDGRLIACDVSEEWTAIARRYWAEAGLAERIELRLGPASDTLAALAAEAPGSFDFAFIDADKTGYDAYYDACLVLLRQGGLVAIDNMLWGGDVADPRVDDETTRAIRQLNAKIRADSRVDASLVPIGDGVMLARKR